MLLLLLKNTKVQKIANKWLLILCIFLLFAQVGLAKSGLVSARESQIADLIIEQYEGINNLTDIDLTKLDLEPEDPSHLYLGLYQQHVGNNHELALRNTAIASGYNYFTIRNVIEDESIEGLSDDTAVAKTESETIRGIYNDELLIAEASSDLLRDTYFFDLYANGVDDAEFDLVNDLQEIHELLFIGKPPTLIESNPDKANRNPFASALDSSDIAFSVGNNFNSGSSQEESEAEPDDPINQEPELENQFCPADPELLASLQDHENKNESVDTSNDFTNDDIDTNQEPLSSYQPRQLSNAYSRPGKKCEEDEFFCIDVEKVFARTQNYFPGDQNCVACQISAINKFMDEELLNGGSLYPGRVTGLFGEAAECKQAFINLPLDLNITIEAKPLVREGNSAADKLGSQKAEDFAPQPSPIDDLIDAKAEATQTVVNRGSTDSLISIQEKRTDRRNQINQKQVSDQIAKTAATSVTSKIGFDTHLVPKIQAFNGYLDQFRLQIVDLQQTVDNIYNKPLCSS